MNFSNILAALKYTGPVTEAVQAIEATNAGLPGATKKQLVLASITAAAKVGETIPEPHVAIISALIDVIVGLLNTAGVFGKSPVLAVAK
jgi:hypothetical protein